jgi:small-conductance mechanosensitive channel
LGAFFSGKGALFLVFVGLVGWGTSRSFEVIVRALRRLGVNPKRKLAAYHALWDFVLLVLVAWAIAARLLSVAPILSLAGLSLALVTLATALREQVQDVIAGLNLVVRRRLREGDRVQVGDASGIVRRLALTGIELRRSDGSTVYVPARLLGAGAVVVGHAKDTVPVHATVSVPTEKLNEAIRLVYRTALMSPYRAVGSAVAVERQTEAKLRVEIQAWSDAATQDATLQLESALRRALAVQLPELRDRTFS